MAQSRLPAVSQDQTILSGPGGLEGAAAFSVLLVSEVWQSISVSRSLSGPDHTVWSWRTARHRYTQYLAGLMSVTFS